MGNFKVYTTFNKSLDQTAPSAWNALKLSIWGPLANWKFEPSPKAHTHPDPIINKHRTGQKPCMGLSWHALNSALQVTTLYHTEKQGLGYLWLSKIISRHTHQNWLKSSLVSETSAYLLQNYVCFSPLTSGLESFGDKSTPSDRPWIEDWGLLSKILASTKKGGT